MHQIINLDIQFSIYCSQQHAFVSYKLISHITFIKEGRGFTCTIQLCYQLVCLYVSMESSLTLELIGQFLRNL